ncbi:MAG: response regulator transcription factor [Verrucomicrobia bacterium]|nr:response regulator transcription factor [Verrucomicrobiota bacterium]
MAPEKTIVNGSKPEIRHRRERAQPTRVGVLIVEDHTATRDGLRTAINSQRDLRVLGVAGTWQDALVKARRLRPEILLLDLNLPDGNGWTLLEQLRSEGCLPRTLVLSVCEEAVYARRLLRAGARGYLMKDEPLTRVLGAIRQIHAGHIIAGASISSLLMAEALDLGSGTPPSGDSSPLVETLSDRELLVSSLLARDLTNKQVSIQLGLSEKTVHTYKARIMTKLGVQTTPELVSRLRLLDRSGTFPAHHPTGGKIGRGIES